MPRAIAALLIAFVASACADEAPPELRPAPVAPAIQPTPAVAAAADAIKRDAKKGDRQDAEWVPAEHKTGAGRWKDAAVYVDGRPVGFITWGEIPITLKPIWKRDRLSANKRAGTNDPGWRWFQQRFYRFTDYLKALGIDIRKVKEMHVYGPRFSNSLVVTGAELQSPLAKEFLFHFGASVSGKALPRVPEGLGSGRPADKISSIMVYIEKKPPTLTVDGFVLDGHLIENVPYFGDPIRGGVRVYLDDRYAAILKRQDLDPKTAKPGADGEPQWRLADVLAAQGVDTSKVVEIWLIRGERRAHKLPGSELANLTFEASPQARGGVFLGEQRLLANAIALHTREIAESELPFVTPDDQ